MTHSIKLNPDNLSILKGRGLNWSVLTQKHFTFSPVSFTSEIEGLKPRSFTRQKQLGMMEDFLATPFAPRNFCITSAPNDGMAKLLAAWMMQHALERRPVHSSLPLWIDLLGGFDNKYVTNKVGASLLVLNNVGTDSTQPKMEKLRDIMETYTDIPKIVVAHGCDPYMFFQRYLYLPLNGLAYITTSAVKRVSEI